MNDKHLAVSCSSYRLFAHLTADGSPPNNYVPQGWFSLNLWTSWAYAQTLNEDEKQLMCPWEWDPVRRVKVWFVRKNNAGTSSKTYDVQPYPDVSWLRAATEEAGEGTLERLKSAIDRHLNHDGSGDDIAHLLWDPRHPHQTQAEQRKMFRNLLGYFSTLSAPIPYRLNLTHCFHIPDLPDDLDHLFVAPWIRHNGVEHEPDRTGPLDYDPTIPEQRARMQRWNYSEPVISAYGFAVETELPSAVAPDRVARRFIDLETGWIKTPDRTADAPSNPMMFGANWSVTLENRIAEAWDFAGLLIRSVGEAIAVPQVHRFRATVLAMLRDRAGFGITETADGAGLLRLAVQRTVAEFARMEQEKKEQAEDGGNIYATDIELAHAEWLAEGWYRSLADHLYRYEQREPPSAFERWLTNLQPIKVNWGFLPAKPDGEIDRQLELKRSTWNTGNNPNVKVRRCAANEPSDATEFLAADSFPDVSALPSVELVEYRVFGTDTDLETKESTDLPPSAIITTQGPAAKVTFTFKELEEQIPEDTLIDCFLYPEDDEQGDAVLHYRTKRAGRHAVAVDFLDHGHLKRGDGAGDLDTIVAAGSYILKARLPNGHVISSHPNYISGTVASDLRHFHKSLESEVTARQLVYTEWLRAIKDPEKPFGKLSLAEDETSEHFLQGIAEYEDTDGGDSPIEGALADTGTLDLRDGRIWLLTVGDVELGEEWQAGKHWELRILDSADEASYVTLRITHQAQPDDGLLISLQPPAGDSVSWTSESVAGKYHVRFILQAVSNDNQKESEFVVSVHTATFDAGSVDAERTWQPAVPDEEFATVDLHLPLTRAYLKIHNPSDVVLDCAPPSALAVEVGLAGYEDLVAAWDDDTDFQKARAFVERFPDIFQEQIIPPEGRDDLIQAKKRLSMGHVARELPIIYAMLSGEYGQFPTLFSDRLLAAIKERIGWESVPTGLYSDYQPSAPEVWLEGLTGVQEDIGEKITDAAKALAKQRILPPETGGRLEETDHEAHLDDAPFSEDEKPTDTPHPLVIQLDHIDHYQDAGEEGLERDEDLLRTISGMGVLIHQGPLPENPLTEPSEWRCLNMARIVLGNPANEVQDVIQEAALVPTRIPYRNGMRQALLAYNNHPLAARSPAHKFMELQGIEGVDNSNVNLEALFHLDHVRLEADSRNDWLEWGKLVGLKFGQRYHLLPFKIGCAGDLPPLLTESGPSFHPARLRSYDEIVLDEAALANIRAVHYLRCVRIGTPRMEAPCTGRLTGPRLQAQLPKIGENVFPLCRELDLIGLSPVTRKAFFFHDEAEQCGKMKLDGCWRLDIGRVSHPGRAPGESQTFGFELRICGFQSTNGRTPGTIRLQIRRSGVQLRAQLLDPPGTDETIDGAFVDDLDSYDFRLAYDKQATTLRLKWRKSDIEATWKDDLASWVVPMPELRSAWACVELLGEPEENREEVAETDPNSPLCFRPLQLLVSGDEIDGTDELKNGVPAQEVRDESSVLLLKPGEYTNGGSTQEAGQTFCFGIRPPATDLNTWDRWIAMDEWEQDAVAPHDGRIQPWAEYHRHLLDNVQKGKQGSTDPKTGETVYTFDLTCDDPAVTETLTNANGDAVPSGVVVELTPLLVEANATVCSTFVAWDDDPRASTREDPGLPHVRKSPLGFRVEAVPIDDNRPRIEQLGDGWVAIRVRERELWSLRIHAAVHQSRFMPDAQSTTQRFPASAANLAPHYTHEDGEYRLFSPWETTIEVATKQTIYLNEDVAGSYLDYPHAADADQKWREHHQKYAPCRALYDALLVNTLRINEEESIRVSLLKGSLNDEQIERHPKRFRYVTRIDLARQTWRWRGRDVPPFPFGAPDYEAFPDEHSVPFVRRDDPDQQKGNVMLWDAYGFGDRDRFDYLTERTTVGINGLKIPLFTDVIEDDRRALYYRFAATAVNRYQGLYKDDLSVRSLLLNTDDGDPTKPATLDGTAWRREVVKCRLGPDHELPKPVVKLIVPLTQKPEAAVTSDEDMPSKTPGLLVVLDEDWFRIGGLAEVLEAEVLKVANPKDLDPPEEGQEEDRQDPEWYQMGADPILDKDEYHEPPTVEKPLVSGPLGHTFDTDTSVPKHVASTFIVHPPQFSKPGQTTEDQVNWYFAQLRFCRKLLSEGCCRVDHSPPSKFTEAQWVQFLPGSDELLDDWTDGVKLEWFREELQEGPWRCRLRSVADNSIVPCPPETHEESPSRFLRMLLITQPIYDFRGQHGEERYLALCECHERPEPHWQPVDSSAFLDDAVDATRAAGEGQPSDPLSKIRLRLVEFQMRREENQHPNQGNSRDMSGTEFWNDLFGRDRSDEVRHRPNARMRVVRVSNPIDGPHVVSLDSDA